MILVSEIWFLEKSLLHLKICVHFKCGDQLLQWSFISWKRKVNSECYSCVSEFIRMHVLKKNEFKTNLYPVQNRPSYLVIIAKQNLEATKISFDRWKNKQTVVYPDNEILARNRKKWAIKPSKDMEEP